MSRGFGAGRGQARALRETKGFGASEDAPSRAMDVDLDTMSSFLEGNSLFSGKDNEDDRAIAMHLFASQNYGGQFSKLYEAVSKIDYKGPDVPQNENQSMMLDALESEFGANRSATKGFGAGEAYEREPFRTSDRNILKYVRDGLEAALKDAGPSTRSGILREMNELKRAAATSGRVEVSSRARQIAETALRKAGSRDKINEINREAGRK